MINKTNYDNKNINYEINCDYNNNYSTHRIQQ